MNATNLFAEILISGMQTLAWLCFVAATVFEMPSIGEPSTVEMLTGSVVLLAISYFLGVIFDRLWEFILDKSFLARIKKRAKQRALNNHKNESDRFSRIRSSVFSAESENAAASIDYARSRMRVARSSAFNLPLIMGSLILYTQHRSVAEKSDWLWFALIVGVLLTALAWFAYYQLRIVYYHNLLLIEEGTARVARRNI